MPMDHFRRAVGEPGFGTRLHGALAAFLIMEYRQPANFAGDAFPGPSRPGFGEKLRAKKRGIAPQKSLMVARVRKFHKGKTINRVVGRAVRLSEGMSARSLRSAFC